MKAKEGEDFLFDGYYSDNEVAVKGIYCRNVSTSDFVRVLKFNSSYNDDGRKIIKELNIETCHYDHLQKLIVPYSIRINGESRLPSGCVIERY